MSSGGNVISTRNEPTDVVNFRINLNGSAVSGEYQILSLTVVKTCNKISTARVVIADGDAAAQDFPISSKDDSLVPGSEIDIAMGYHGSTKKIFKGIITKHALRSAKNKHSYLTIEAKNKAVKMTLARKSHCFTEKSDKELIEEIIKKSAFGGKIEIEGNGATHKEMVQFNVSDWDFIVSRAEANSLLVFCEDDKLTIGPAKTSSAAAKELTYGIDVLEFESEIDGSSQLRTVVSHAWNSRDQEIEVCAEAKSDFAENGNVKSETLADKFGGEFHLYHAGSLAKEELKSWSDAKLQKSRFAKSVGRIKIKGTTEISVGQMIKLTGFGKRINGNVLVTGIRQNFNESIWETDVQFGLSAEWFSSRDDIAEKPAAGLLPGVNGLQIAVVIQLESDPDNQHRVKIKLPLVDDKDGIWARIASLDAGNERGSFFLPEVGDEVIVGFINDDPRYAVILGMLNSNSKPAPLKASDNNHEKGFVTRSKMKFIFNDEKKSIILETPKGKKIEVNDESDLISLTDDHNNIISMGPDGIKIESGKDVIIKTSAGDVKIDGLNIQSKASINYSAQSNAQMELKSSGITVIKGSLVNIN